MTVRVTVEGGGSFELTDEQVGILRDYNRGRFTDYPGGWAQKSLAAALPPEPYQPKEGDRVAFRIGTAYDWSDDAYEYIGTFKDWQVIRAHGAAVPRLLPSHTEFRRAES